jgi:hypothetical protein
MPAVRKLGALARPVKLPIGLLGRAIPYELANSLDRAAPLFEHRSKDVPRVNHVWPYLELDLDPG